MQLLFHSLCLGLNTASMDNNQRGQQRALSTTSDRQPAVTHSPQSPSAQRLPPKKFRPSHLILQSVSDVSMSTPPEGDQVVPSFQRLSVYEHSPPHTPNRCAKPLPPLPGSADLSSDEAVDSEVEFFTSTDESQSLVPDSCLKPPAFRCGAPGRRSFRGCGQINYAYNEGHGSTEHLRELRDQQKPTVVATVMSATESPRQQDRAQRRLRRSHSGPAGSFNKPAALRLSCHHHGGHTQDKPEVPPRVPIPPRPSKAVDCRRWSAEVSSGACSDEDKPPKVPPREPLSRSSSRTPSPKSLPMYINGVMPPTQSFAPNPKYVSKSLQRQNSTESPAPRGPCILPIIENGKKASTTHYFLLPTRPAYLDSDKLQRFFKEDDCGSGSNGNSSPPWDCEVRQKSHIHMV
ncbi:ERBB receptor feedback inhibitor 1 isoform X2 [Scleropages formosus]|uniref:ERBB receptor feedback inhibitor 1 isoform X2 n=1 Tax=Scleropages formosus TaxID=113540 RepID=UPI00087828A1|nr:ERBB receptor feedback inhibitor 1-like isoform X2 [Scleropages formosus]